jgi:hypothetical protein
VDGIHKAGVVPVLDDIVGSVMDLHLDGVPAIVDQEDYAVLRTPQHCRHILGCHLYIVTKNITLETCKHLRQIKHIRSAEKFHLEAPIANASNHTLVVSPLGVSKQCTN